MKLRRFCITSIAILLLAGCASELQLSSLPVPDHGQEQGPVRFSNLPIDGLMQHWQPMILLPGKRLTEYRLVRDEQRVVLQANARGSSSGLIHKLDVDPVRKPWIEWEWKVAGLIPSADNTRPATEDAPARIVLAFDGNKETLPFADQVFFEAARMMTGRDLPYATLIYIWENKAPVDTIIANSRSKRIQKLVVASGINGVGTWQRFERNIVDDYQRAFGESPGRLIGIGVLTDTDNTGATAHAWYGDIQLKEVSEGRAMSGMPQQDAPNMSHPDSAVHH